MALIGVPLEAWTGYRIHSVSRCIQTETSRTHQDFHPLVFVTDPAYPIDHQPSSVGPGHYHVPIDLWRELNRRVTALEVERDLRKGAAAGNSG